jgi:hypothetical protein
MWEKQTEDQITFLIAVYGALTGTIALGWDFVKWRFSEARLVVRVMTNMLYHDGTRTHDKRRLAIVVQNRGGKPTTLTLLGAESYHSLWHRLLRKPSSAFIITRPETGQPIPYTLEVGHEWTGMVIQTEEMESKVGRRLYILVYSSNRTKPIRCHVKKRAPTALVGRA